MINKDFHIFLKRAFENAKEAITEANPCVEEEHLSTHSDRVYSDKISSMMSDYAEAVCICYDAPSDEKPTCQREIENMRIKISEHLAGIGIFE